MRAEALAGKKILLLGGQPHEAIDGVRYYANHSRPGGYALAAAMTLAALEAEVTLVNTAHDSSKADGVRLVDSDSAGNPIGNTQQLFAAAAAQTASTAYDAIINLASICAIRPALVSDKKLKVKKETGAQVSMQVVGNPDVEAFLHTIAGTAAVAGYSQRQEWFTSSPPLAASIKKAIENAAPYIPNKRAITASTVKTSDMLSGYHIVVTSGPTTEVLSTHGDIISNFSSGKQGHAIAEALAHMGARVTLVSGPTHLADPAHPGITNIHTESARDMHDAVLAQLPADAYIGVAAVADFGMEQPTKLNLTPNQPLTLSLVQNPDILQAVGTHASLRPAVVVGFAAETHDLLNYARGKLEKKGADAICANPVSTATAGSDQNQVTWVTREGNEPWGVMDKNQVANRLCEKITALLQCNIS